MNVETRLAVVTVVRDVYRHLPGRNVGTWEIRHRTQRLQLRKLRVIYYIVPSEPLRKLRKLASRGTPWSGDASIRNRVLCSLGQSLSQCIEVVTPHARHAALPLLSPHIWAAVDHLTWYTWAIMACMAFRTASMTR